MKNLIFVLSLFCLFVLHSISFAQNNEELIKVTDQLYMITGLGGNISFLVTDEGVLLVDAGTEPNAVDKIEKYIKSITGKPIKYLVFTHYHLDHTLGARGFNENFKVIGNENISKNLIRREKEYLDVYCKVELPSEIQKAKYETDSLKKINDPKWKDSQANYERLTTELEDAKKTKIVLPDITFKDEMKIFLGNDTINLKFPGNTHTNCSILVEFSNQNAIAAGDFFFYKHLPFIDYNAKCNTKNWIDQLKNISSTNFKYVIPGHGKLTSGKEFLDEAQYLTDLRNAVQSCISNNRTISEAQNEIKMEKYSSYGFQDILPREIEAVYKELKGM